MSDSTATAAPAPQLPLFYIKPAALTPERHANARVKPEAGLAFAQHTNSIPLNTIEFIEAAKFYPIVFTTDEAPIPVALVGLEQENYFVSSKGDWTSNAYIPAYLRQYPFIFLSADGDQYVLCIDEGAPHYAEGGDSGTLLFEDGKQSGLTGQALEFCTAFLDHFRITQNFCADLKAHNLLVANASEVKLNDGRSLQLNGFQLIDETAFNALSDEVYLEFRRKGWLAFIHLALAATSNWKNLANAAAEAPKKAA